MNTEQIAKLRTSFGRDPQTGRTNNNTGANNNTENIVNVTYGHDGSGKVYSYRDPKGTHRTGDNVVVPVKHGKSGKEYNTLATIRSTHSGNTGAAMDTRNYLSGGNMPLKAVTNERQSELPNYYPGWDQDAQGKNEHDKDKQASRELRRETWNRTDIPTMQKLSLMREVLKMRG